MPKKKAEPAELRQRANILLDEGKPGPTLQRLKAAGFHVESHLEEIGMVTGDAPSSLIETLKTIKGVKSVERESTYQLAPPDSPVQ